MPHGPFMRGLLTSLYSPPPYSISPPYLRTQFMGLDHLRSLFTPTVDVAPIGVGEHLPHSRP